MSFQPSNYSRSNYGFDPLAFGVGQATSFGVNQATTTATASAVPAKGQGQGWQTANTLISSTPGLIASIGGLFGSKPAAPPPTDPAMQAMLLEQQASARRTQTMLMIGGGVVLLGLVGTGIWFATRS